MKKNFVIVPVTVVGLVVMLWAYSGASSDSISACVAKDGLVRVIGSEFLRSECKANETPLSWNMQGEKGDKGDSGEDTSGLHLFDNNHQDLGVMLGVHDLYEPQRIYQTYVAEINALIEFQVRHEQAEVRYPNSDSAMYFALPNCGGDPFVVQGTALDGQTLIKRAGSTTTPTQYYLTQLDSVESRTIVSAVPKIYTGECIEEISPSPVPSYALKSITLPFTEPLAWPLEARH